MSEKTLEEKEKEEAALNVLNQKKHDIDEKKNKLKEYELTASSFMKKYASKKTVNAMVSMKPDFQNYEVIIKRIKNDSNWAKICKFLHLFGYKSNKKMSMQLMTEIKEANIYFSELEKCAEYEYKNLCQQLLDMFQQEITELENICSDKDAEALNQLNEKRQQLEKKLFDFLSSEDIQNFNEMIISSAEKLGADKNKWEKYERAETYPDSLMIGRIIPIINLPECCKINEVKEIFPMISDFRIPYIVNMKKPFALKICYHESRQDYVMTGVQSFLLKWIRLMPMFSKFLTYIDPIDRGKNLGILLNMISIPSTNLCKVVCAAESDISERLKELLSFVDRTIVRIAGYKDIYDYNENCGDEPKIPFHLVVVNDYPFNFHDESKKI